MDILALLSKLAENGTYAVLLVIALGGLYWMFVLYKESQEARVRDAKENAALYQDQAEKNAQFTAELRTMMINTLDFLKILIAK